MSSTFGVKKRSYRSLDRRVRRNLNPFPHIAYTRKRESLFVHIRRTGGASMSNPLGIRFRQHFNYRVYEAANPALFRRVFKFCFIRNPYQRCLLIHSYVLNIDANLNPDLSRYIQENCPNFRQYVLDFLTPKRAFLHSPLLPRHYFVCNFNYKIKIDFVGRFERINPDFSHVCQFIGIFTNMPILNSLGKRDVECLHDDKARARIYSLYKMDFEIFGYVSYLYAQFLPSCCNFLAYRAFNDPIELFVVSVPLARAYHGKLRSKSRRWAKTEDTRSSINTLTIDR